MTTGWPGQRQWWPPDLFGHGAPGAPNALRRAQGGFLVPWCAVPKQKTDRGAAKRFKVTGTGKLRRHHAMRSHLAEKKESSRMRRLGRPAEVARADAPAVRRMLGL